MALKGHIRKSARWILVLYLTGMVFWSLLTFFMRTVSGAETAFVLSKVMVAAGIILSGAFFHFSLRYAEISSKKWTLPGMYGLTVLMAIFSFSNFIVTGVKAVSPGYMPVAGSLFPAIMAISLGLIIASFTCIHWSIRKAKYGRDETRDTYIFAGFIFVTIGGIYDFLPMLDIPLNPGSIMWKIVFFVVMAVALLKPRLIDVQRILRKALTYVMVALIVGLVYAGAMLAAYTWYGGALSLWLHAIVLVLFVVTLRMVWDGVEMLVDMLFFKERYKFLKQLNKFMLDSYDIRDYMQLGSQLVNLIENSFQARYVGLLVRNESNVFRTTLTAGEEQPQLSFSNESELLKWLGSGRKILNINDIETEPELKELPDGEKRTLREFGVDLIFPLKPTVSEIAGLLVVGSKKSGKIYSEDETALLMGVAESVANGVENARIHHYETLLVNELKSQNEKKTEFLHSIVHELKTPLTSLLSSTELLEEDIGTVTYDQRERIINNIKRSAGSMDRRVSELLDFTRSQTGNLELKLTPTKIVPMLDDVYERMMPVFRERKQTLKLDTAESLPLVLADTDKLEQVLINLLSNASKFSSSDTEIVVRTKSSDDFVIVEVEDCAPIIGGDEKEKVFEAYYRGKTGVNNVTSPGLGLGLAIARKIVELHKGKIWVDGYSEKGNIFSFTVPVFKE